MLFVLHFQNFTSWVTSFVGCICISLRLLLDPGVTFIEGRLYEVRGGIIDFRKRWSETGEVQQLRLGSCLSCESECTLFRMDHHVTYNTSNLGLAITSDWIELQIYVDQFSLVETGLVWGRDCPAQEPMFSVQKYDLNSRAKAWIKQGPLYPSNTLGLTSW
jgi:hypothetical protein